MRLGAAPAEQLGHALVFLLLGVGLAVPPLLAAGTAWGRRRRRRTRRAGGATAIALADEAEAAGLAPVQCARAAGEGGARHADRTLPPRAANL